MDTSAYDVLTLGFSNRDWEETLAILRATQVQLLADVRTAPGSRKFPWFNQDHLQTALPEEGIDYVYMPQLGGFRKGSVSELNAGWRNASFRRYADYMQTAEFREGIDQLIETMGGKRTIYVCTEAVFWRCHRALISDALLVRGYKVGHVFSATKVEPHRLTPFAKVEGLQITYPAAEQV